MSLPAKRTKVAFLAAVNKPRQTSLLGAVDSVYKTGQYSDCVITCGFDRYKVHKAIICPQSEYFRAVFNNSMMEGRAGVVDLKEDDPEAVKGMVFYMYHSNYEYTTTKNRIANHNAKLRRPTEKPPAPDLLMHVKLYIVADKYGLAGLLKLVTERLQRECTLNYNHEEFVKLGFTVYGADFAHFDGLRDIVASVVYDHMATLEEEYWQSLRKTSELCSDVLQKVRTRGPPPRGRKRPATDEDDIRNQ